MKRLVLAGAGHAHALVLRALVRQPMHGVEIVVISPEPLAPYSGMVPGWLSGHYRFDEIAIDFPPLAAAAGARWCQGEIHALDPARRQLQLADGSTLDYDVLSLNVGSTLQPPPAEHAQMLPLRPLAMLHRRYEFLLERWAYEPADRPFVVTALGGGAGMLAGLGILTIPGLGPVVAAGWLASIAVGAAAGAAAGGVVGALVDAGLSKEHADVYSESVRRGCTLVSARVSGREGARIQAILDRYKPINPVERGGAYRREGWTGFDPKAPEYRPSEAEIERIRRSGPS